MYTNKNIDMLGMCTVGLNIFSECIHLSKFCESYLICDIFELYSSICITS